MFRCAPGDPIAQEILRERHRVRNAPFAGLPLVDLPEDHIAAAERQLAKYFEERRVDVATFREVPSFGPSFLALWTEAKKQGLPNEQAALYIHNWATAWSKSWDRDAERKAKKLPKIDPRVTKRLRQVTEWRRTGDLNIPWNTQVSDHLWQIRINDFPREYMYSLLIDGEEIGDFNKWPEVWDRGEKRPESEGASALIARPVVHVDASTLLVRYQNGECEAVWRDLVALGADVRKAPFQEPAWAVAEETMRRAKHNVELLIARLNERNYQFSDPKQVHRPMNVKETKLLERAERKGLWLPLSARAWLQVVGQVDLNGSHPTLCFMDTSTGHPGIYADPLQVWFWQLEEALDTWTHTDKDSREPQECIVSMTAVDKAGRQLDDEAEGGYHFTLPNGTADGLLEDEPHGISFVEYLRLSFRWGGFPGWEKYENRPENELNLLKQGLLPI